MVSKFAIFLTGMVVGAVSMYVYLKNRECIDTVREDDYDDTEEHIIHSNIVNMNGYSDNTIPYSNIKKKGEDAVSTIKILPYEKFNELSMDEDMDIISLNYYSDGVLTDEADEVIENPLSLIGNALSEFKDTDSVYVQNADILYEICRDLRKYSDITDDRWEGSINR